MSCVQQLFANHYGEVLLYDGCEVALDERAMVIRVLSAAGFGRQRRRSYGRARNPRTCFHFGGRFYQLAFQY